MRAGFCIVTGQRVVGVGTGPIPVCIHTAQTDIIGTKVVITAAVAFTRANSGAAHIRMGAIVRVITGRGVNRIVTGPVAFRVQAARTNVVGADIPIITGISGTRTNTIGTGVRMGTGIIVITGCYVEGIVAVFITETDIVGADIPIIAGIGRADACARSITGIRMGTTLPVITSGGIVGIRTGSITVRVQFSLTDIVGTDFTIVAAIPRTATGPISTGVRMGAGKAIVTGGRIIGIGAFPNTIRIQCAQTGVVRADVTIITGVGGPYAYARPITGIRMGTAHSIITGGRIEGIVAGPIAFRIQTARTVIICADVTIVTAVPGTHA